MRRRSPAQPAASGRSEMPIACGPPPSGGNTSPCGYSRMSPGKRRSSAVNPADAMPDRGNRAQLAALFRAPLDRVSDRLMLAKRLRRFASVSPNGFLSISTGQPIHCQIRRALQIVLSSFSNGTRSESRIVSVKPICLLAVVHRGTAFLTQICSVI